MAKSQALNTAVLPALREHRDLNIVDRIEPVIPACFWLGSSVFSPIKDAACLRRHDAFIPDSNAEKREPASFKPMDYRVRGNDDKFESSPGFPDDTMSPNDSDNG